MTFFEGYQYLQSDKVLKKSTKLWGNIYLRVVGCSVEIKWGDKSKLDEQDDWEPASMSCLLLESDGWEVVE